MNGKIILCIVALFLTVICINFADSAYDMTQGSDWKWAYAEMYVNDSLSNMVITNEDIAFARMKVAAGEKDCKEIGDGVGQWCDWAEEDRQTLARMLKAQASQSIGAQVDTPQTMWERFKGFFKRLFGLS